LGVFGTVVAKLEFKKKLKFLFILNLNFCVSFNQFNIINFL
jgi:hypothetical protein